MGVAISELWAYISVRPSAGGGVDEELCYMNGRPLVAPTEAEAQELLREALLTPGRVRLRRFRVSEGSSSVSLAFSDLLDALEHLGDGSLRSSAGSD
jgi:hypothetical protein